MSQIPLAVIITEKKFIFIITKILNHHNHETFRIQKKLCIDHQNKKANIIKICVTYTKKYQYFADNQTTPICSQHESLIKE